MKQFGMREPSSLFSPLERAILGEIWPDRQRRVRDIYSALRRRKRVALSSIAVTLDRLYGKGVVDRQVESGRGGLRYIYFPRQNKEQFEKSVVESTVDSLIDKFGPVAVNYFNERFSRKK